MEGIRLERVCERSQRMVLGVARRCCQAGIHASWQRSGYNLASVLCALVQCAVLSQGAVPSAHLLSPGTVH